MTRKEELEVRATSYVNLFATSGTEKAAKAHLMVLLTQVEQEVWERASQRPYTVHTSHHNKDYCEGYVRASEDYAAWCREQRKWLEP